MYTGQNTPASCKIVCHISWRVLKVVLHLALSELALEASPSPSTGAVLDL